MRDAVLRRWLQLHRSLYRKRYELEARRMIPVDVALATEAVDRAVKEILGILTELQTRNMGDGGDTYGTEHMTREDRILAFLDDVKSGALDHLKVLNEKAYIAYLRQYREDVAASPQMQPVGGRA